MSDDVKQRLIADFPEKVTVRVLPEKRHVYPEFRDLVTKKLGSDVCFVTTSLWEAFTLAMKENPPVDDKLEIKFLRQNVQINIGCQILYQPKKARRTPGSVADSKPVKPWKFEEKKNVFFPLLMDQWKTLDEAQKMFWRKEFIKSGIMPLEEPQPVDPKPKVKRKRKKAKLKRKSKLQKIEIFLKKFILSLRFK